MEGKEKFTGEEVKEMLMKAFIKGEDWGVTYGSWYISSEEDKSKRASKDCFEIYQEQLEKQKR